MTPTAIWPYARFCIGAVLVCLSAACRVAPSRAAEPEPRPLTLDRIFGSGEFGGEERGSLHWRQRRGGYVTFESPADRGAGRDLVWHNPATGEREIWVPARHFTPAGEERPLSVESFAFSADESKLLIFTNSRRVWRTRSRGDYWVLDIAAAELKKLGGDAPAASLMFARFSPDGNRVAYLQDNDLYVQDLRDLSIRRLTHDGSPKRSNGTFDWVYEEELLLRDGFRFRSDGAALAYWQIDSEGVGEYPLVQGLSRLYPRVQWIPYPKVGEKNPAARIGVVSAAGGETVWLELPGDPREHYLAQLDWVGETDQLLVQQFNRLQNENRLFLANGTTGSVRCLLTETDSAWVENHNARLHWIGEERKRFVWLSERDGWQHAYAVDLDGGEPALITPGEFDVISVEKVDPAGEWLYFLASPENPTQRYLYRARIDGTRVERLTPADQPGSHGYDLSPDARWAGHSYSTFSTPPAFELIRLPDHGRVRTLSENKGLKQKLAALAPVEESFFRVNVAEGIDLDGWCIKPPRFDASARYPVLFHVYGEPAGQTVLDRWGGRSYLWHRMLAERGYVVISIDNRGTPAPRGREWRKCIYRQVGILASADQAAAVRALLADRPYLDPKRVAVWGWSGGGSMALNAILRYPDLYRAAIAVAPVPNQRFYDTIYQERYMGLPGDNAEGYRLGSPITFAHQLKGQLLLVHGTADDNCHYQGTEALIHELVAHNKQFSMFAYPGRSHGIYEGRNTTRHLHGLLTDFLERSVPPARLAPPEKASP